MTEGIEADFPQGLLRRELFLGLVCGVAAHQARVNLSRAEEPSGSHFESARYGRGEVGELVLIEGQQDLILGRLTAVQVPDSDRREIGAHLPSTAALDASAYIQFLGTVRPDNLIVAAGVAHYPRLGDKVFAAPHPFVGKIPLLMNTSSSGTTSLSLLLGHVSGSSSAPVALLPEKVFGRHCAVLGSTGGGKSWTVARLIGESTKHVSKTVLLDATGEYRDFPAATTLHFHLGSPISAAPTSSECTMTPHSFQESDFIALFEPSGKVQGPKLREAIKSLRLVHIDPSVGDDGVLKKANRPKSEVEPLLKIHSAKLDHPATPFDPTKLAKQLMQECVWPDSKNANPRNPAWGGESEQDKSFCLPLAMRIHAITQSEAFRPVFGPVANELSEVLEQFLEDPAKRLFRLCLSGVSFDYNAREFIANAVGRLLLTMARAERFKEAPLLTVLDEAHNFLGHRVGYEDGSVRLDAFELIAREGRKYGLNLCLATQRPRDLTEGVLSQIGTLIVHRLTNDRDREIVERACGEVDRSATAFLANLRQGEAAVVGVDFPIPMTVQVCVPTVKPVSDGPDYQKAWKRKEEPA